MRGSAAAAPGPAVATRSRSSTLRLRVARADGKQDHVVRLPLDARACSARQRQRGARRGDLELAPIAELYDIVVGLSCECVEDNGGREVVPASSLSI